MHFPCVLKKSTQKIQGQVGLVLFDHESLTAATKPLMGFFAFAVEL